VSAKKPRKRTRPGANLKQHQWKPGQSGNPKGRPPKDISLTTLVKEIGDWAAPKSVLAQYRQLFPQLPTDASCAMVLAARNMLKALDLCAE